ncbi:MAG: CHAD domain-containing protein [Gammaproteobacteria bacterium]|nr:CHAD domain-containing protein [Gammaproteobacteria bacterium]
MPFHLIKREPIAPGLRRIAREQIIIGLEDSADTSIPGNRGVHSLRIRCKKLRGLLRLPQPLMGDTFAIEDRRIRRAAKQLAQNRDSQVIARLIASFDGSTPEPAREQQPVSRQDVEASRRILTKCLEAVDDWPLDLHGFYDIAPGFARTYRKCLAAWQRVMVLPSDQNFHRLRKWGKYHWYHIRILERLNKPVLRKRRKRLRKLQLTLGDAHDLVLLQSYLGVREHADEQLLRQVTERKNQLYEMAVSNGRKLFRTPANELVANLSRCWAEQGELNVNNWGQSQAPE